MSIKYNVWITNHDGERTLLSYRNRTSWTFRTAMKYADEFVEIHGCLCSVVAEVEE
jgi:hypothetical protein